MEHSLAGRPRDAATDLMQGWRRIAGSFAIDLAVSLALVLVAARLWGAVSAALPQNAWAASLHAAFARFGPGGVWDIYCEEARSALAGLAQQGDAGAWGNLLVGLQLLLRMLLAVPATLAVVWQQTDSIGDWIILLGFSGLLVGTFLILLTGRWLSLTRLLVAAIGSPLAALALFWMTQQSLLNLVDGFGRFPSVAPWCVLCPIACTLYWLIFPHAAEGASLSCVRAVIRLHGGMHERRRAMATRVKLMPPPQR